MKRQMALLIDFDPQIPEYHGNAQSFVPKTMKKVKGDHLSVKCVDYTASIFKCLINSFHCISIHEMK